MVAGGMGQKYNHPVARKNPANFSRMAREWGHPTGPDIGDFLHEREFLKNAEVPEVWWCFFD
jgi:hypothetical protein